MIDALPAARRVLDRRHNYRQLRGGRFDPRVYAVCDKKLLATRTREREKKKKERVCSRPVALGGTLAFLGDRSDSFDGEERVNKNRADCLAKKREREKESEVKYQVRRYRISVPPFERITDANAFSAEFQADRVAQTFSVRKEFSTVREKCPEVFGTVIAQERVQVATKFARAIIAARSHVRLRKWRNCYLFRLVASSLGKLLPGCRCYTRRVWSCRIKV